MSAEKPPSPPAAKDSESLAPKESQQPASPEKTPVVAEILTPEETEAAVPSPKGTPESGADEALTEKKQEKLFEPVASVEEVANAYETLHLSDDATPAQIHARLREIQSKFLEIPSPSPEEVAKFQEYQTAYDRIKESKLGFQEALLEERRSVSAAEFDLGAIRAVTDRQKKEMAIAAAAREKEEAAAAAEAKLTEVRKNLAKHSEGAGTEAETKSSEKPVEAQIGTSESPKAHRDSHESAEKKSGELEKADENHDKHDVHEKDHIHEGHDKHESHGHEHGHGLKPWQKMSLNALGVAAATAFSIAGIGEIFFVNLIKNLWVEGMAWMKKLTGGLLGGGGGGGKAKGGGGKHASAGGGHGGGH